jgi:hypothetical protein
MNTHKDQKILKPHKYATDLQKETDFLIRPTRSDQTMRYAKEPTIFPWHLMVLARHATRKSEG